MDKYSLGYRDLQGDALRFVKAEAFYILVFLAVVLFGGWQAYVALTTETATRPHLESINKKAFNQRVTQDDATANRRTPELRSYRILSQGVKLSLLYASLAAVLMLIIFFIMRGRWLPPMAGPQVPWGLWDILKVAALFGLVSEGLRFVCVNGASLPLLGRGDWYAAILARIFAIGAILLVVLEERKGSLAQLGIRGPFWRNLTIGAIAFIALQAPFGMWEAVENEYLTRIDLQETLVALVFARDVWVVWLIAVTAIVVAPVAEELLFRGYLQPAAERWFGTWPAILISAVFFAVIHGQFGVMIPLLVLGLVSAWIFSRTRSLVGPITLHVLNNAYVFFYYLAIRYPGPHK